ncbi:ABC transporter substrate-binding protein, partial [Serratia sp. Se-PFBMAAmG]|nr:ABC transporter substrate-binding protein [Serratia sp. Se-PFBMAAmG]
IVGMEILAKDLYPQQFADLTPTADFRTIVKTFTKLPDDAIDLSYPDNK